MPLRLIQEYRFDLEIADQALNSGQCKILIATFQNSVAKGNGNKGIDIIIKQSLMHHIACRATLNPEKATFQEYLIYLYRRAQ